MFNKVQENPYPLRIDKVLFQKFKIIAKENGRSANKEIEMLIKKCVLDFEKENGPIDVSVDD